MLVKRIAQSALYRSTGYMLVDTQRFIVSEKSSDESLPAYPINCQPRSSFEVAKQEAGEGYLAEGVLAGVRQHPEQPIEEMSLQSHVAALFATLAIAKSTLRSRPLRVIDFGGALGIYFHLAQQAFEQSIELEWVVVETKLYVRHAQQQGLKSPPVVGSINEAFHILGSVDLVVFSGVLQYLESWTEPLLNDVVRSAPYILISRTPTGDTELPFLQTVNMHTKFTRYPGRILRLADIRDTLQASHKPALTWEIEHHLGEMGLHPAPSILWKRR